MFKEYCNCYANIFSSQISNVQMSDKTKNMQQIFSYIRVQMLLQL